MISDGFRISYNHFMLWLISHAIFLSALAFDPPTPLFVDQSIKDIAAAQTLEVRVQSAQAKVRGACVGLEILDTLGPKSSGSGTIISKDGWIMTAGHVCGIPNLDVTIYFMDGTSAKGKTAGLYWDGLKDCGLIRFDSTGRDLVVAELGSMEGIEEGDWIISFGHTYGIEKDPFRPPVLRLGRMLGVNDGVILMDAPLSSGDSGGGVFDLDGRLVGINSTAGQEPSQNSATTIDFAKSRMTDMQQSAAQGEDADLEREKKQKKSGPNQRQVVIQMPSGKALYKGEEKNLQGIAHAVDQAILMTVGVFVDGKIVCYGTVADASGFILAKASEVGKTSKDLMVALPDGLMVSGKRIAVDQELDLVLIQTSEPLEVPKFSTDTTPSLGAILVTVGRDGSPLAFGVRSLDEYRPGRSDVTASYLGVRARESSPEERSQHGDRSGVILMQVPPGMPAGRAGLRAGDFVTRIAGTLVATQEDLGEAVRKHAAGEVIEVIRVKDDQEEVIRVRLAARPREFGPPPSTPNFPASKRTSGFGPVIQHDTTLRSDQIGGPLVDLNGNIVGVNIARVDRTKSYALSSAVVKSAIDRLVAQAKDQTEPLQIEDPLISGIAILQDGPLIRLDANSAEIIGATLRFTQVEDTPSALDTWVDSNDSARWLVEFTKPGDYAVTIVQSCAEDFAGQEFEVSFGATTLKGKTEATADWSDFKSVGIGSIHVEAIGRAIIEVKTGGWLKGPLMNLHGIELKRTS